MSVTKDLAKKGGVGPLPTAITSYLRPVNWIDQLLGRQFDDG